MWVGLRPTTASTGPSGPWMTTWRPGRSCASTPPTLSKNTKPLSSTYVTMRPIWSLCPVTTTCGRPSADVSAQRSPSGSDCASTFPARRRRRTSWAGASKPVGPGAPQSSRRSPMSVLTPLIPAVSPLAAMSPPWSFPASYRERHRRTRHYVAAIRAAAYTGSRRGRARGRACYYRSIGARLEGAAWYGDARARNVAERGGECGGHRTVRAHSAQGAAVSLDRCGSLAG